MKNIISIIIPTIVYTICVLALTGCATSNISNIPGDHKGNNEQGIAILSLTASGECGYAYFLDVRSSNGEIEHTIAMQDAFEERDWKRNDWNDCSINEENFIGKLAVIELPPGEYEIHKLTGVSRYHTFDTSDIFALKFKVTKNSIKYIGNAHFYVMKKTYFFKTQNKQDRDINLFHKKYPRLKDKDISLDLIEEVIFQGA